MISPFHRSLSFHKIYKRPKPQKNKQLIKTRSNFQSNRDQIYCRETDFIHKLKKITSYSKTTIFKIPYKKKIKTLMFNNVHHLIQNMRARRVHLGGFGSGVAQPLGIVVVFESDRWERRERSGIVRVAPSRSSHWVR